jgi:hypothetical protein
MRMPVATLSAWGTKRPSHADGWASLVRATSTGTIACAAGGCLA